MSMTNEELVMLAKQGDKAAMNNLYFAVAPLLFKLTSRFFPLCGHGHIAPDDLLQCRYFVVMRAVKAYNPDKELLFNSYLHHHVQNVCLEELGYRGKKSIKDPCSLDDPLYDDNSLTRGDALADPDANSYSYCELNDMQIIVRGEIDRLPPLEQSIIYMTFYQYKMLEESAETLGLEYKTARNIKFNAYRRLQKSERIQELRRAFQFNDKLDPEGYIVNIDEMCFTDSGFELL